MSCLLYSGHRAIKCMDRGDVEGNLSWLERAHQALTHRVEERAVSAPAGDDLD